MNLLARLAAAARRIGLKQTAEHLPCLGGQADPELADRLAHAAGRKLNRRELFRLAGIGAATGLAAPAVAKLILEAPATIVLPPAPAIAVPSVVGPSNAEVIAAQFEKVRPALVRNFEASTVIERLMDDVEPHLGDMLYGRDPWAELGYDPNAPFRGRTIQMPRPAPSAERMVGGLYVPDGRPLPANPWPPQNTGSYAEYERRAAAELGEDDDGDRMYDDYDDEEL